MASTEASGTLGQFKSFKPPGTLEDPPADKLEEDEDDPEE